MYSTCKEGRVNDALQDVETMYKDRDEITQLKVHLKLARDDLNQVVEEKQVTLALKAKAKQTLLDAGAELEHKKKIDASTSNMHKCLRLKAEQERDKLKEDKIKLEHFIELVKHNEGARSKA
jgi:hypothetical protein